MKEVLVSFFIPSLSKPESKSVVKTSVIDWNNIIYNSFQYRKSLWDIFPTLFVSRYLSPEEEV